MKKINTCKIEKISSVDRILSIIDLMPDVRENLVKRVELKQYCQKLFNYADNFELADNGETKGLVSVYANDTVNKSAFISLIACVSGQRGKGYGGILFDYVCAHAKEKGMVELNLEVDCTNVSGIAFYTTHGMKIISDTEHGHIMSKKI